MSCQRRRSLRVSCSSCSFLRQDLIACARTEIRATCHGISAAAGKLGAVIGSAALAPALNAHGLPAVMFACGAVALVGAACTVGFTKETMGVELELAKEGLVAADASSACNTEHV